VGVFEKELETMASEAPLIQQQGVSDSAATGTVGDNARTVTFNTASAMSVALLMPY
jgi:hypothetical protein